ncbi:MAG: MotA/TolQ/ExbB proton channel family protein [Candidatus Tectomicrobia bacterium]|nr:MotA/TolQ/ExbB proton channel family protein [Candidatus Tectomicrobia bacterium]
MFENFTLEAGGLFELIIKGGPVMIPLLVCSVISLGIAIERLFSLRSKKILREDVLTQIEILIREDKIHEATALCKHYESPMTRILFKAIVNHEKEKKEIKEVIEDQGRQEAKFLEKYLTILGTIANISPLLGLFGTVIGMIKAFNVIGSQGMGNAAALGGGIAEALITTAAGLIVGIPTLIFHNYFANKAEFLVLEIEKHALRILDILKSEIPTQRRGRIAI